MVTKVSRTSLQRVFAGLLMGTAVGDALGLPAENLSPGRIRRMWKGEWRMRFIFGRGMISDDTEHTLMVAQALLAEAENPERFQRLFAWKLQWWFAGLPGGVGLATAKACLKLWFGFPSSKSAVVSAGSGPAMRSAVIGAFFADEPEKRRAFVLASSRLTHRSWQAETAALAVAEVAAVAVHEGQKPNVAKVMSMLRGLSQEREWQDCLLKFKQAFDKGESVREFIDRLGLAKGVTGYSLHVVLVAIYAWLRPSEDFRSALVGVLECGGDTDTVGAILGALVGASVGIEGIPQEWLEGIAEWPRSMRFIGRVAERLTEQKGVSRPLGPVRYFWPGIIPRNVVFFVTVLIHGFRRLAPPY